MAANCKRVGEDVAEKLDYTPGTFTVERHIRGKWACAQCETLIQALVPAHVIDKGIPTTGLLAHVLIAKYLDHLPLYRQAGIFGRAGLPIPQSTLAEWVGRMGVTLQPLVDALKTEMLTYPVLHADETPVAMLDPGAGKTHRAYLWSYSIGAFEPVKAVVYDFADSRAGKHAREFLGDWRGTLVCDDYAGYKALIADGSSTAKAIDYSLKRWKALVHCLDDGQVPIDNNWIENRIRPIATGRKNWLFAGSLRAGKRAAAIMSLIQSAKLNGHDPFLFLKDILSRLPTQHNSRISELLPHRWQPEISA